MFLFYETTTGRKGRQKDELSQKQCQTKIFFTLLWPKGQITELGCVNAVEKRFKVKLYTQCRIYRHCKKNCNTKTSAGLKTLQG